MIDKLLSEMKFYLGEDDYNEKIATVCVNQAISSFRTKRNYRSTRLTEDEISKDIEERFYYCIFDLAIMNFNKYGVEGQKSDNENGRNRVYMSETDIYIKHGAFPYVG